MPDALEGLKVEQRHREAAAEHYPPHLWRLEAIDDLAHAFARFEANLSHTRPAEPSEDEIERVMKVVRLAYSCGYTDRPGDLGFSDNEHRLRTAAIAAIKDRSDG